MNAGSVVFIMNLALLIANAVVLKMLQYLERRCCRVCNDFGFLDYRNRGFCNDSSILECRHPYFYNDIGILECSWRCFYRDLALLSAATFVLITIPESLTADAVVLL